MMFIYVVIVKGILFTCVIFAVTVYHHIERGILKFFRSLIPDVIWEGVYPHCRNMSSHALTGRPAARLETMGFVDKLVFLDTCFNKKQVLSLYWEVY